MMMHFAIKLLGSTRRIGRWIRRLMPLLVVSALAACAAAPAPGTAALRCDDSLKTAFKPDAATSVVSVRAHARGEKVFVSDSSTPVTLAADLCLVKLKVGPGNPGPADARATSQGIGIEVWLPTPAQWNQRIRNYGGGGYAGGGHLNPAHDGATLQTALGSKFPAPVIAGMGYASGTTDAGQPWSQNGSFAVLPDGRLNDTLLKDFAYRSLLEQAHKTRALATRTTARRHATATSTATPRAGARAGKWPKTIPSCTTAP